MGNQSSSLFPSEHHQGRVTVRHGENTTTSTSALMSMSTSTATTVTTTTGSSTKRPRNEILSSSSNWTTKVMQAGTFLLTDYLTLCGATAMPSDHSSRAAFTTTSTNINSTSTSTYHAATATASSSPRSTSSANNATQPKSTGANGASNQPARGQKRGHSSLSRSNANDIHRDDGTQQQHPVIVGANATATATASAYPRSDDHALQMQMQMPTSTTMTMHCPLCHAAEMDRHQSTCPLWTLVTAKVVSCQPQRHQTSNHSTRRKKHNHNTNTNDVSIQATTVSLNHPTKLDLLATENSNSNSNSPTEQGTTKKKRRTLGLQVVAPPRSSPVTAVVMAPQKPVRVREAESKNLAGMGARAAARRRTTPQNKIDRATMAEKKLTYQHICEFLDRENDKKKAPVAICKQQQIKQWVDKNGAPLAVAQLAFWLHSQCHDDPYFFRANVSTTKQGGAFVVPRPPSLATLRVVKTKPKKKQRRGSSKSKVLSTRPHACKNPQRYAIVAGCTIWVARWDWILSSSLQATSSNSRLLPCTSCSSGEFVYDSLGPLIPVFDNHCASKLTWIVSTMYTCHSCGCGISGTHPQLLASLPPHVRCTYPSPVSWVHSDFGFQVSESLARQIQSEIRARGWKGATQVRSELEQHCEALYTLEKLEYLQQVVVTTKKARAATITLQDILSSKTTTAIDKKNDKNGDIHDRNNRNANDTTNLVEPALMKKSFPTFMEWFGTVELPRPSEIVELYRYTVK